MPIYSAELWRDDPPSTMIPLYRVAGVSMQMMPLESRRMLSATLESGLLRIGGTTGSDSIFLGYGDATHWDLSFNGTHTRYLRSAISGVRVDVGAGNDVVTIGAFNFHTTII